MNIVEEIKAKGKEDPWFSVPEIVRKGLLESIGATTHSRVMNLIFQGKLKAEKIGGMSKRYYKVKASWIIDLLTGGQNGI